MSPAHESGCPDDLANAKWRRRQQRTVASPLSLSLSVPSPRSHSLSLPDPCDSHAGHSGLASWKLRVTWIIQQGRARPSYTSQSTPRPVKGRHMGEGSRDQVSLARSSSATPLRCSQMRGNTCVPLCASEVLWLLLSITDTHQLITDTHGQWKKCGFDPRPDLCWGLSVALVGRLGGVGFVRRWGP